MIFEIVVGVSESCGTLNGVYKSVCASCQVAVIYPDVPGVEDTDAITVCDAPMTDMLGRAPDHGRTCGLAIVDENSVYNDVTNVLNCNAGAACDVDFCPTTIDGLVAVHDELLVELDRHVTVEGDPKWLILDHCMAKGSGNRRHWVVVSAVRHLVNGPVLASQSALAKPE